MALEEIVILERSLPSYLFGNVPANTDQQILQMDKICISAMLEIRKESGYVQWVDIL